MPLSTNSPSIEAEENERQQPLRADLPIVKTKEDEIHRPLNVDHPIEAAKKHVVQWFEEARGHEMDSFTSTHALIEEAGGMIPTVL